LLAFLLDNAVAVVFGVIGLVTSVVAIHYARRMYELERRTISTDTGRSVTVYSVREEMIDALLDQYKAARQGDEVWAQAVGLQNFPGKVHDRVMTAASRGATFRYLVGRGHPALQEFVAMFSTIKSAQIAVRPDNDLRVQGLSDREVVIAFPTLTTYTAIKFTDPAFVRLVKDWFEVRWEEAVRSDSVL
jgi:hypothetical protein